MIYFRISSNGVKNSCCFDFIFYFLEKMAAVVDNLAKNKRHFSLVSKRPSF
jgi:hypothetical protein